MWEFMKECADGGREGGKAREIYKIWEKTQFFVENIGASENLRGEVISTSSYIYEHRGHAQL